CSTSSTISARIRASVRSGISECPPQVGTRPCEVAAHGTLGDVEEFRGAGRVEVVPVRQIDNGTLTDAEAADGLEHLWAEPRWLPGGRPRTGSLTSAAPSLGATAR